MRRCCCCCCKFSHLPILFCFSPRPKELQSFNSMTTFNEDYYVRAFGVAFHICFLCVLTFQFRAKMRHSKCTECIFPCPLPQRIYYHSKISSLTVMLWVSKQTPAERNDASEERTQKYACATRSERDFRPSSSLFSANFFILYSVTGRKESQ